MTEATSSIARLDRSKAPPGYIIEGDGPDGRWCWEHDAGGPAGTGDGGYAGGRDAALAAAWTHHEARCDPPGMTTEDCALMGPVFTIERRFFNWPVEGSRPLRQSREAGPDLASARAAAWAWYWRRIALAQRLGTGPFAPLPCECSKPPKEWHGARASLCQHSGELLRVLATEFWPRCLAWSDEQVAEVERWLAEGGEPPEVLR